jgi:hypothetical protein
VRDVVTGALYKYQVLANVEVIRRWKLGPTTLASVHRLSQPLPIHCPYDTTSFLYFAMNISGTLNVFRLLRDPTLCLPQQTVSTFNHLPIPLSKAFPRKDGAKSEKEVDIQAVVLDKDNCFAVPHTDEIHPPYHVLDATSRPKHSLMPL